MMPGSARVRCCLETPPSVLLPGRTAPSRALSATLATPQRPSRAARLLGQQRASRPARPPARQPASPPARAAPRPFPPGPSLRSAVPPGHERPCCLLAVTAVTKRSRVCARPGTGPFPGANLLRHLQAARGRPAESQAAAAGAHPCLSQAPGPASRPTAGSPLDSLQPPGDPATQGDQTEVSTASQGAGRSLTSGRAEDNSVPEPSVPVPLPAPAAYRVLRLPRGSWRAPLPRDGVCGARVVALGGRA